MELKEKLKISMKRGEYITVCCKCENMHKIGGEWFEHPVDRNYPTYTDGLCPKCLKEHLQKEQEFFERRGNPIKFKETY
jgi:hypothetical protein